MALTRDFKEAVRARVQRDPAFRRELLREGVESFLAGDGETGKSVLLDYINATIGFTELAEITHHSSKSFDADARPFRESLRQKPVRDCFLSSGGSGCSLRA